MHLLGCRQPCDWPAANAASSDQQLQRLFQIWSILSPEDPDLHKRFTQRHSCRFSFFCKAVTVSRSHGLVQKNSSYHLPTSFLLPGPVEKTLSTCAQVIGRCRWFSKTKQPAQGILFWKVTGFSAMSVTSCAQLDAASLSLWLNRWINCLDRHTTSTKWLISHTYFNPGTLKSLQKPHNYMI